MAAHSLYRLAAAGTLFMLAACASGPQTSGGPGQTLLTLPYAVEGAEGRTWSLVRTPDLASTTVTEAARALADADVIFLGEMHDSPAGHDAQLQLTRAIAEQRRAVVLSFEMFERDAQPRLDLYLAGAIDEERFLESSRPWPNYRAHYRPAVEFARLHGFPVVAANVPRRVASAVARRGLLAGLGSPWAARRVDVGPGGEYRRRFAALMPKGRPSGGPPLFDPDDAFAAQCIKDDTMAESIADALEAHPGAAVIHWNGMFHSDFGLGTVERLRSRRPELNIAVVSMVAAGQPRSDEDLRRGHFLVTVPRR